MALCGFQVDAFDNNAFQVCAPLPPSSAGGAVGGAGGGPGGFLFPITNQSQADLEKGWRDEELSKEELFRLLAQRLGREMEASSLTAALLAAEMCEDPTPGMRAAAEMGAQMEDEDEDPT